MPRLSARKKAVREANRQNILKRWKKDNSDPTCIAGVSPQQVAGESRGAAAPRFHPAPTQSAASFRHSLLPPEYANIQEVSENSGMYNISHQRLSELLNLLTDKQIDAYQRYFGKAIRASVGTNTLTMKLKIMSAFWHSISTDENPHHVHCDSSWCIFKKASEENKPLPSHSNMKNYLRLDKKYKNRVREIFFDLSSPALLEKCLKGGTQNKNESLHSKLWHHQSKSKFAGLKRIQFVTRLTILDHNFGFVANKFLQRLDFPESPESFLTKRRMDQRNTALRRSAKRRKLDLNPGPDYQPVLPLT
ncbi:hypothetical protein E2C01_017033 [Portunus trituberculatus]|uniref:Uncharacterized protein n=1 Tax=Portunus trituberculatus TaxID=210409 RepID=A0A5B7DSA8_PORTR|nr:hypothetical protein [Portunus trituberculatus]